MTGVPVYLRVYDISDGIATTWSPILLGKKLDGVWHTGVEVFGYEYFFGGGIVKMRPQAVEESYGITPTRVHHLGLTRMSQRDFERFLSNLDTSFNRDLYDLVKWNCNNFTDHICRYLLNRGIPSYILDLPEEINKTFMGKIILNFMKMFTDAPAVDSEDATHPKQLLCSNPQRIRMERRNSCPPSPTNAKTRPNSVAASQLTFVIPHRRPAFNPASRRSSLSSAVSGGSNGNNRGRTGSADDSMIPTMCDRRAKAVSFRMANIPPLSAIRNNSDGAAGARPTRRNSVDGFHKRGVSDLRKRRNSVPVVTFNLDTAHQQPEKRVGGDKPLIIRQGTVKPVVRQRSKSVTAIDMSRRCSLA